MTNLPYRILIPVTVLILLVFVQQLASYKAKQFEAPCGPIGQMDGDIHFVKAGQGSPIVFLHGAALNLRDYANSGLVEKLSTNHTVYLLDRPGSGHSPVNNWDGNDFNQFQVDQIFKFLERQKVHRPILVGHSLGGAVISALAAQHPESFGGLLLLAGATYPVGTGSTWYTKTATTPIVGWIFNHLLVPFVGDKLAPKILAKNFSPNPVPPGYAENACLGLLFSPDRFYYNAVALDEVVPFMGRQYPNYAKIKIPASLIYGEDDQVIFTQVHSHKFLDIVPQAKLHMLKATGHLPHHSNQDLIVSEIQRMTVEIEKKRPLASEM